MNRVTVTVQDSGYPARFRYLSADAPPQLTTLGNLDLLSHPMTALFCSARCPGKAILRTYDQAAKWRDEGQSVISGFHSPVEKECLRILLRGTQPIIICPARGIPKRIPQEWRKPLEDGRLLILSFFPQTETRITADLAARRNQLVAALADEVFVAHATPGGRLETTFRQQALAFARRPRSPADPSFRAMNSANQVLRLETLSEWGAGQTAAWSGGFCGMSCEVVYLRFVYELQEYRY